ncbi:hypothetical protein BRC81_08885 [Halobacteriales archaeon QS_1_68_20]|nr:MAG: hypothetical protein BRC81_08885 [Halobacteriales archaeon QS_1_68_20]
MSTQQNPIGTMFELQRSAIENSQRLVHQSLDAQTRGAELAVETIERSDTVREQGEDVTKAAVNAYFDALATAVPGDAEGVEGLRETVLEQFDVVGEVNEDAWEAGKEFAQRNAEAVEEFSEEYASMVDDAFDAFLQTHEQAESSTRQAADVVQQGTRTATEIAVESAEQAADAVEESAE